MCAVIDQSELNIPGSHVRTSDVHVLMFSNHILCVICAMNLLVVAKCVSAL